MLRILALVLLTPALPCALAQMNMAGHVMEMQDEIPPEKLPPPIPMSGIGNSHIEITATPEAQIWFDQGLNLLHDFWDYESARAFEQGVRVDPQCAMCYWGLYKAESFYHSTAQGLAGRALAKAVDLKEHVSERERLYIDAANGHSQEQELLRQIVTDYPQDIQARILLANAGGSDSLAILESVLRQDPENSAANHYYIHALEFTDLPERALHSADILGRLAPSSAHMVHMPGHIYFRVGDYARAAQAFAAALAVDKRYMGEQHVEPDNNWNYVHNLMYSIANLLEQGKFDAATSLSADITGARGKLDTTLYPHMARDSISQGGTYGLGGAAAGPLGVRAALGGAQWRMMAECCLDMGDVPFFPGVPLDEMLAAEVVGQARAARYGTSAGELPLCVLSIHRSIAVAAAAAGMRVLSLGGDHSITAAALLGIQRLDVSVIHVDSHADLSTGRDGLDLLHSTWIHYVDQRSHLPLVIQIGVPILGGHPKPAIEGHFKTGQR